MLKVRRSKVEKKYSRMVFLKLTKMIRMIKVMMMMTMGMMMIMMKMVMMMMMMLRREMGKDCKEGGATMVSLVSIVAAPSFLTFYKVSINFLESFY